MDLDLDILKKECEGVISKFGKLVSTEVEPIAFGMKSVNITVVLKELPGGTEPLEIALSEVKGVGRAEAIDVRRLM